MDKLHSWLQEQGLEHYSDSFQANDITYDLLDELNQDDLRALGLSLGHQKRFLRAIRLMAETAQSDSNQRSMGTGGEGAVRLENMAVPPDGSGNPSERRQLTVMFCDLADSTALVSQIGAEEMQELFRAYQEVCSEAIARYSGFVAQYLGDGVLAYFGYPRAHELDADRAVRAGFHLIELLAKLDQHYRQEHGVRVVARIGIATGPVVVGDIVGKSTSLESAVVGETPNLAARIQAIAKPNSIMVSELTHRLANPSFEFVSLGVRQMKGISQPQSVWEAVGMRNTGSRFNALAVSSKPQLIGRHKELQLLKDCWLTLQRGVRPGHRHTDEHTGGDWSANAQLVFVCGEAGIGKSHLVESLVNGLSDVHPCLRFQCSPYHKGTVLHPVLEQIERQLQNDRPNVVKPDRAALLALFSGSSEWKLQAAEYFGSLMSIEGDSAKHNINSTPPQSLQEHAFNGWIEMLIARFKPVPGLIIIEDAHWLDATSTELFGRLIGRLHELELMIVVSARPEFNMPWDTPACEVTNLQLSRLDRRHGHQIISQLAKDSYLAPQIVELILDKTDGVPLFVEELTKSVLDSRQLELDVTTADDNKTIEALNIPETLNDLLMSRLDKSPYIKGIAQIGAAIGRDFPYRLLASLAPHEETELQDLLAAVVESELVLESGALPSTIYTFRHALLQDAAYQSLLIKNRRRLHEQIATVLESRFEHTPAEVLAHHWSEAGGAIRAVRYWQQAARDAVRVWANAEAVKRYRHALRDYETIADDDRQAEVEMQLLLELGSALRAVSGTSATETIAVFSRAIALCSKVVDTDAAVRACYGAFATNFTAARLVVARESADRLLSLSRHSNHVPGIAAGHQALGMCFFAAGDLAAARLNLERALSYQTDYKFDHDIQYPVLSQSYLSWTLFLCGEEVSALTMMTQAITEAESVSPYNHALAMANGCYLHQFRNDIEALAQQTSVLKALASEKGLPVWFAVADFFDCWQRCCFDGSDENLDKLVEALQFWAEDEIETPYFKAIVAALLLKNGRQTQGQGLAKAARALALETGELWFQAQIDAIVDRFTPTAHAG